MHFAGRVLTFSPSMLYHHRQEPSDRKHGPDQGRCEVDHRVLRELFRHLQEFEALFQAEGIDSLTGPDGTVYSLFDLRRLYDMRVILLPRQRARAIEMFLYEDMREQDAAVAMGLSPDTPVAIYATQGLKQLATAWTDAMIWKGIPDAPAASFVDAAPVRCLQGTRSTGRRTHQAVA